MCNIDFFVVQRIRLRTRMDGCTDVRTDIHNIEAPSEAHSNNI